MRNCRSAGTSQKQAKRCGFKIKQDLALLRSALQHNPWQLGKEMWENVVSDLAENFDVPISKRTAKRRINILLAKYELQQLPTTTGNEVERSERGSLLEEVAALVAESKASINSTIGAQNGSDVENPNLFSEAEVQEIVKTTDNKEKKNLMAEKKQANEERDELLKSVPEPISSRSKRFKLSLEDEMIVKKQEHEMNMDIKRLELEREKLEFEKMREARKEEDSRRRDELAASQIKIQSDMLLMLSTFINKT